MNCFRIRIPNRVERCQYNRGDFLISQHLSKYALKNPKKTSVHLNKQQLSNKWAWKFQNIKQQRELQMKKKRVLINQAEKCYGVSGHYVNSLKQWSFYTNMYSMT